MSGLLFSLGETWNEFESGLPCAAAFLNNDEGCVFGWAGVGRVSVTVGGLQVVPRWIRIVDRAGREGRVATFWPQVDVRVVIDWWPEGNNRSAPVASLEAEWTPTDIPGASQEKFRLALASEIKRRGLDKRQRLDRPAADAAETPVTPLTELWAPLVKPEDPGRVMAAYLLGGLADPSARPAAFPGEVRDLIRKLHEPIVEAIERKLLELEGKRFESLASQQQFVKDLGELLGQLDLRIKCQECGAPSTLVVIPRNSTRGTFQFRHQGRGRTNHGRGGDRKSEDGSALPRLELIADNPI
jgi:hypothetical protein